MDRTPVTSSNVKSVGHDKSSSTLEVEFQSGDLYQYVGVSEEDHTELMESQSIGKHINTKIKPRFKAKKL